MTLIEHLAELRSRIIKMLIALAFGVVIGYVLYNPVLEILQDPYCKVSDECSFLVTDPLESFSIRLKLSTYVGFLVASPVIMWQIWRFIVPAMHAKEKRYAIPFVIQVWMFATPVVYPASLLPERWRVLAGLNPMAGVVEGFRWALLGKTEPPGPVMAVSLGVVLVVLVTGLFYFRRMERTFADVV